MPLVDKQLTQEHEKVLWNTKELDLDTSKGLLHAVIFYLIKCFAVWHGKELRQLQTNHISFGEDKLGKYVALDLQSSIFKRKRVVKRYDDPANPRSVYKILKKYRSRIANEGPFLVRPISSIKDFICFGPLPLGVKVIKTLISTVMEDAGIGRCFVNYSLNLQSINTLMRFGTGYHCLSSWLVKGKEKYFLNFPTCSSANCEDINPEISVMISRLLDAPCPYDAVEIIQKMEYEEEQRSTGKDSDLPPNFDSWMSNVMTGNIDKEKDGKQNPKISVSYSMDLTEIERESSSDEETVDLISMKGKISHDEKPNLKNSNTSEGSSGESDLKIMTVSSITEGAFSQQIDEGDHISDKTVENEIHEKCEENINLDSEGVENDNVNFKFSSRKRKNDGSAFEKEHYKLKAKVSKFGDLKESSSKEKRKEFLDEEIKKLPDKSTTNIEKGHSANRVRSVPRIRNDSDNDFKGSPKKDNQELIANTSEDNRASTSLKSVEDSGEEHPSPSKVTLSSSRGKFSLPNPDSSQDSITILRMLLHQPLDEDKKTFDKKYDATVTLKKNTSVQQMVNPNVINNVELKNDEKDNFREGDFVSNCITKCEQIVKTESNDEDEQTLDLSPPTLSPQPPTIIQETDDSVNNQGSNSNSNSSLSAPNLISSDIVQFLDKAHQQIKDILNATETKNDSNGLDGEFQPETIQCIQTEKSMLTNSKHSRNSRKPVKIIDNTTTPDFSSEKPNSTLKESYGPILKQPSKPIEQSDTQFPLLRLCLEQPIHEAELAMSTQHTSPSSSKMSTQLSSMKQSLESHSPSLSYSQTNLPETPNSTYKANVRNSLEPSSSEDDSGNDKEVEIFQKACSRGKKTNKNSAALSAASSPLPISQPTVLQSQQPNTAVYHVEKDLINNVVYQSLHVNYEKDGARTFTFADVPYVKNASSSQSKSFKGSKQTSEINLGDYFPPGTLIPAKDIHLLTSQNSDGCDILMKFCFCSKTSQT